MPPRLSRDNLTLDERVRAVGGSARIIGRLCLAHQLKLQSLNALDRVSDVLGESLAPFLKGLVRPRTKLTPFSFAACVTASLVVSLTPRIVQLSSAGFRSAADFFGLVLSAATVSSQVALAKRSTDWVTRLSRQQKLRLPLPITSIHSADGTFPMPVQHQINRFHKG